MGEGRERERLLTSSAWVAMGSSPAQSSREGNGCCLREFSICECRLGVAAIDFLLCLLLQLHPPWVFMGSRRASSPCWADSDLPVPFRSPSGSVPARYNPRVSSCPRKPDALGSVQENLEASSVTDASLKYLWLVSILGSVLFHTRFVA